MKNSNGMTLISVLIASALVGLLAMILATLFGSMGGYMTRASVQTDIDQVVSYVSGILSNPNLCDYALRDGSGGLVVWNYNSNPSQTVARIEVDPDGPGSEAPSIAVKELQQFSPSLQLLSMTLREPDTSKGEPGKVRRTVVRSGVTYDSISARLVFNFKTPQNMTGGGALRERFIDLTLGLDSSHRIQFCSSRVDGTSAVTNFTCSFAVLNGQVWPDNVDCDSDSRPNSYCQKQYYVRRFESPTKPICGCAWICPNRIHKYYPWS